MVDRQLIRGEIEVTDALAELGLSRDHLVEGMRAGEAARDTCTRNDPVSAPGHMSYFRTVRGLREVLGSEGWTPEVDDGLELVISPSGQVALGVAVGDEGTGTSNPVKSKYPKGDATIAAVGVNRQLPLFPVAELPPIKRERTWVTWFLLRRRFDDTLYCELSRPQAVGDGSRIVEWVPRIILPSLQIEPRFDIDSDDESGHVIINVPRR